MFSHFKYLQGQRNTASRAACCPPEDENRGLKTNILNLPLYEEKSAKYFRVHNLQITKSTYRHRTTDAVRRSTMLNRASCTLKSTPRGYFINTAHAYREIFGFCLHSYSQQQGTLFIQVHCKYTLHKATNVTKLLTS
jgi:hypothetical protein